MSECYPTGCPPCDEGLNFPENPADGDRECVVIDAYGNQKCWVYDKCIPGWRAEGTSSSPVQYRGGINLTRPPREPSQYPDLAAGDLFVVISAANASTPSNYPGLTSDVEEGERVVYSGSDWQLISPEIQYADEALGDVTLDANGKPDPDNRMGGIVKNATLSQAIAGTDKCDTITPYTLQGALDASAPGDGTITIKQGGTEKGSFTVNQEGDTTIELDDGGDLNPGDGQLTITQGGQDKGTFTANQTNNTNIAIDPVNNSTITFTRDGQEVASFTLNQSDNVSIDLPNPVPSFNSIGSSRFIRTTGSYVVGTNYLNPESLQGTWRCDGYQVVRGVTTIDGTVESIPLALFLRVA